MDSKDPEKSSFPKNESKKSRITLNLVVEEFEKKISDLNLPEEKISEGILFMREALSQEGTPHFKEFWDARKVILPLFKENLNPVAREKLWSEFLELTVEARKLKEILEEQSGFAIEQIELAISALEGDYQNFDQLQAQLGELTLGKVCETIREKEETYLQIQRELNLLNTLAGRLNSLRKEVLKTDMRVRFKTKIFKRLSALGDQVFPKRKSLIDQISDEFEKDVERFVQTHFQDTSSLAKVPHYVLREEIKALQNLAKVFTLNSGVFSRTRLKLSECWDQVKSLEKEKKKISLEKKQESLAQKEQIVSFIEELKEKVETLSLQELEEEIKKISEKMKEVYLFREDVMDLKAELQKLKAPHLEKQERQRKEQEESAKERARQRKEQVTALQEKVSAVLKQAKNLSLEALNQSFEEIIDGLDALQGAKIEKQQMQRQLRLLKQALAEKKEEALLNLSDDEKKTLENLREVLVQKKARRQEIKKQLEVYRKMVGSSGLDFEKSMQLNEIIDQEKELLEKTDISIEEIEEKIQDLGSNDS